MGFRKDYLDVGAKPAAEKGPNRGAVRAGCVAAAQASAKALFDFCPIPVAA